MGSATARRAAHLFDQVRDLGHVARKNIKWPKHVLHGNEVSTHWSGASRIAINSIFSRREDFDAHGTVVLGENCRPTAVTPHAKGEKQCKLVRVLSSMVRPAQG